MNNLSLDTIISIVALWAMANEHRSKADIMIPDTTCMGKYKMFYIEPDMKIKKRSFTALNCEHCLSAPQTVTLNNTSETIVIKFIYSDDDSVPTITEGPLAGKGTYRFEYAYFNWLIALPETWRVTEKILNAEMHVLFYNTKYGDYEKALGKREGIAVLSSVIKVRPWIRNNIFDDLATGLQAVRKGNTYTSIKGFSLSNLLPTFLNEYFTYVGALTLAADDVECPSSDNVIWIDFEQALKITPNQVAEFYELLDASEVLLVNVIKRYEPPQTIIYKSKESTTSDQKSLSLSGGIIVWILILSNALQYLDF